MLTKTYECWPKGKVVGWNWVNFWPNGNEGLNISPRKTRLGKVSSGSRLGRLGLGCESRPKVN